MSQGIADKSFSDFDFHYVSAPETVDAVLSVPVTKLDADQYIAEDLDGVTESLFGSGNLNFLMMQSNQTNEAMAMGGGMESLGGLDNFGSSAPDVIIASAYPGMTEANAHGLEQGGSRGLGTERALTQDNGHADSNISHGNFTHNTIGSITASNTATDRLTGRSLTGGNGFNGDNGGDGNDAQAHDGADGRDGTNGTNGNNGTDGGGYDDDCGPVVNIDIDNILNFDFGDFINIDFGDITNLITVTIADVLNLTQVTNNVTNIVTTIIDTVLNPGEGGLTLALDGIVSDLTHLDLDLIHGDTVLNLVNQTLDLTPLTGITSLIPGFSGGLLDIHSIHDLLGGPGHDHQPGDTDLALGLDGALGNIDLINGVTDVAFNPVEDIVGDIDILGDLGLDLFGNHETGNAAGDSDLTLGLDLDLVNHDLPGGGIEVPLDIVESITGDIDLDLGVATDLLGRTADGLVDNLAGGTGADNILTEVREVLGDTVDGLLGDLTGGEMPEITTGLDLPGQNETDNGAGDTDITIGTGTEIAGVEIPDLGIDIPLDPVEAITGDIDLNLDLPAEILPADGLGGASGLGDLGGGLGDLGGLPDALPLPGDDPSLPAIQIDFVESDAAGIDLDAPLHDALSGFGSDTDISIGVDIDAVGIEVPDIDLDIPLDPVESITGDIDLDVDAAIDLLNTASDAGGLGDVVGDVPGGGEPGDIAGGLGDISAWTENTLPDLTGGSDLIGDVLGGAHAPTLPDPAGGVAEGLGGLLGGHGGGHGGHFGGLFG